MSKNVDVVEVAEVAEVAGKKARKAPVRKPRKVWVLLDANNEMVSVVLVTKDPVALIKAAGENPGTTAIEIEV